VPNFERDFRKEVFFFARGFKASAGDRVKRPAGLRRPTGLLRPWGRPWRQHPRA